MKCFVKDCRNEANFGMYCSTHKRPDQTMKRSTHEQGDSSTQNGSGGATKLKSTGARGRKMK
jgi:hypothetical protein